MTQLKRYDGPAYYKAISGRWVVLDPSGQKVGEEETEEEAKEMFKKLHFEKQS